jgi:hypothetical protein
LSFLVLGICFVNFSFVDLFSSDFQMVVILSAPLRLAQSQAISQESGQLDAC